MSNYPDDHDLIVSPPAGVDHWSENLFSLAYDVASEVGVAVHCGRAAQDPWLWREIVHVFLPSGRALCAKAYGRHRDDGERVAGAHALRVECVEPFAQWRLTYDGVAAETTQSELLASPVTDGRSTRLQFDLMARADFSPWLAVASDDGQANAGGAFSGAGAFHYEQVARYCGSVTVGEKEISFDARGFRDHTRGARKFAARSGHTLLSCSFPDGSAVGLYQTRDVKGRPTFNRGFTVREGTPFDAEVLSVPRFADYTVPNDFTVRLRSDKNEVLTIEGTPLRSLPLSLLSPNDLVIGLTHHPDDYTALLSPALMRCRGMESTGHIELSTWNALQQDGGHAAPVY